MQFSAGKITFPQLIKYEGFGSNPGLITLTGVGFSTILQLNLGQIEVGDRPFFYVSVWGIKGALSGEVRLRLSRGAGIGDITFLDTYLNFRYSRTNVVAFRNVWLAFAAIGRVTTAGLYTINLEGFSVTSNTTVNIGNGQMHAYIIPGSV